jgi:hypothetical protein
MPDLPSATVEEESGGVNPIDLPPDEVCVFIGPCSKGRSVLRQYIGGGAIQTLADERGCGPAVKACAYSLAKTGAPALFYGLAPNSVSATTSTPDLSDFTNDAAFVSITGTPLNGYEVIIEFSLGGVVGTGPITYRYSLDAGATYSGSISLGTDITFVLTDSGLTVTLATGEAITTGDSITFYTRPASSTILPRTTTRAGSSTAAFTVTGTPEDDYDVVFEVLTGGTRGTDGIVYRYSLDGGETFTGKKQLGTAVTVQLLDGEEDSGLDVAIGVGTLDAGDELTFKTTGPGVAAADIVTAIEAVDNSVYGWNFIHAVGVMTSSGAATVATKLDNLEADADGATFTMACISARDRSTNETDAVWAARLVTEWSTFLSDRIARGGGYARITCPITQRSNRRPVMWIVVPEVIRRPLAEDPGRKATGALTSDVIIHDENNDLVDHDARINGALNDAGFVTLRTYKRQRGIYVTRGNMSSDASSDIQRIPQRRVLNKASEIFRQAMEEQLENDLFANPAGVANPGALREEDCAKLDREIRTKLLDELGGDVSDVAVRVSRTTPVLTNGGILDAEVRITGKAYVDLFRGKISFVNPRLAALQIAA